MPEVVRITNKDLFPFLLEQMENNKSVRMIVTGMSMFPFLREQQDSVEIVKSNYQDIKRGDIILALRDDGDYVLHRVWKISVDGFYMVGDAQMWKDGPYRKDQLIAVVTAIWRDDKKIPCTDLKLRILSMGWLILRPFRGYIKRIIKVFR